jgi:RNA polymerase sigma factor (sigma-70 family)
VEILTHEGAVVDAWWTEPERRRVARLCARITGDPVAAEDLAQETLLEAWRIRERLVDPTGSGPWLDAIARNVCRRWRVSSGRLRSREVTGASSFPHEAGHDEVAEILEREELVELLDRALGLLPAETRAALVSRYVDELATTEIARRLRLTPEAVSMRLTRGRARIRELLETELSDDPLARVWVHRTASPGAPSGSRARPVGRRRRACGATGRRAWSRRAAAAATATAWRPRGRWTTRPSAHTCVR